LPRITLGGVRPALQGRPVPAAAIGPARLIARQLDVLLLYP
jgi:hypothetical protein